MKAPRPNLFSEAGSTMLVTLPQPMKAKSSMASMPSSTTMRVMPEQKRKANCPTTFSSLSSLVILGMVSTPVS